MMFDWRAWLRLDPAQNPYLKLNEADRRKIGVKWLILFFFAAFLFWLLNITTR